jgi:hypothetical protein
MLPPVGSIVYHMPLNDVTQSVMPMIHRKVIFGLVKSHHHTKSGIFARVQELTSECTPDQMVVLPEENRVTFLDGNRRGWYTKHSAQRPGDLKPGGTTYTLREPDSVVLEMLQRRNYQNLGVNVSRWWYSGRQMQRRTVRWFVWTPQTKVPCVWKGVYGKGHVKKVTILKALRGLPNNVQTRILQASTRRNANGYNSNGYNNYELRHP